MAAYAALTSLKYILDRLEDHPLPPIYPDQDRLEDHPLPPFSLDQQQAQSLTENVTFLQGFLQTYHSPFADSNEPDPLEMRIADAAYAAEDVIESNIVDRILPRGSESQRKKKMGFFSSCFSGPSPEEPAADGESKINSLDLYEGLQKVIGDLDLIKKEAMESIVAVEKKKDVVRDQLQRQVSASSSSSSSLTRLDNSINFGKKIDSKYGLHQGMRKVIKGMDLIKKEKASFNSSGFLLKPINYGKKIYSKYGLHQGMRKVIKGMDLIKKEKAIVIEAHVSASGASSSRSPTMVGFDGALLEILDKLTGGHNSRQVIPIVGMGGIGKTTLTLHIYALPLVKERFDVCAWATISQKYSSKEVLSELLSQASKKSKGELSYMSEDEVGSKLFQYLFSRRFLIVLDDMWSIDAWDEIQRFFPENGNGSRIVVTTRLSALGSELGNNYCLKMDFLDEGSSWDLFSKSVFGDERCPLELEEVGKQIVENCRGLPLSIVVVGGLLRKMEHTNECWESIRENTSSVVNSVNEDFSLKILKTSYNHLPVHLKPCFLYTGVFEEDRVIRISTLVKLWVSEGFLKPDGSKSFETAAKEYLKDLVDRNLILVHELGCTGNIKYCKIHDLLRDLCWREAGKEGFYNVIGQHRFQGVDRKRRVVVCESTSKEEVGDALRSMPFASSFLCDSTQVLPFPECRLLRTLKAYDRDTSTSYEFSFDDLFRFVNLRYLAAGVHGLCEFPSSISLWNLQTIIILHCSWVYAPKEIWETRQLRHVEVHKGTLKLPSPPDGNEVIMENLQTLKGVCQMDYGEICRIIPNIKKLGALGGMTFNLKGLTKLESFSCRLWDALKGTTFPYSLKKLSLGSSYDAPWDVKQELLDTIGALPRLQKLKLERARFQSKEWETREEQFPNLKFLELKWCILESWMTESSSFPRLEKLHLYEVKELEEIPLEIGEIPTLQSILLEYCSESVVVSAKNIAEEQEDLQVRVVLFNNSNSQELRSLSSPNFLVEIVDF